MLVTAVCCGHTEQSQYRLFVIDRPSRPPDNTVSHLPRLGPSKHGQLASQKEHNNKALLGKSKEFLNDEILLHCKSLKPSKIRLYKKIYLKTVFDCEIILIH